MLRHRYRFIFIHYFLEFSLALQRLPHLKPVVKNKIETDPHDNQGTKRDKMWSILHHDLVVIVIYYPLAEPPTRKECQQLWVVLESIPLAIGVYSRIIALFIFVFLIKVRLTIKGRLEALIVGLSSPTGLLEIPSISGSVLVEILCVSVFEKLVMLSLIVSRELGALPLLKLLPRLLIWLVHISSVLLSFILFLSLSLIHIKQVIFRQCVPLRLSLYLRVRLL